MEFANAMNFWEGFKDINTTDFEKKCKFLFEEFGTSLACNRFDVGNCVEYAFSDMLTANECFQVENVPNAQRYDINIQMHGYISIKYSSSGNIRLHNSLGDNKDMHMKPTFVITPNCIYLITQELVEEYGINLESYLKNTGDALELKRSILKFLDKNKYPFKKDIDIQFDKSKCKHRQCSVIIYEYVKDNVNKNKLDDITIDLGNLILANDE
jgi:hypothetical protein